eukprot:SAG22_NODE_3406_length_1731_cov_1.502451_1_plen_60_part_10
MNMHCKRGGTVCELTCCSNWMSEFGLHQGTEYTFQRRERPEVILKDGHIVGLISGVSDTR